MFSFESLPDWLNDPLVLGFILLIIIGFIFNIRSRLRRGDAWRQIAERAGLERVGSSHDKEISGIYRGRKISLVESNKVLPRPSQRDFHGEGKKISTEILLNIKGLKGASLSIRRTRLLGDLLAPVVGDPEIDRHFSAVSDPDWIAQQVLASNTIRQSLPGLKRNCLIFVYGSQLRFSTDGMLQDIEYIEFLFDFLSDIADVVEGIFERHGPIQKDTPEVAPEATQAIEGLKALTDWFDDKVEGDS